MLIEKRFTSPLIVGCLLMVCFAAECHAELVWVNEFHYDNIGGDTGEFVEIVTNPGFSGMLSSVTLTLYNGSSGATYGSAHGLDTFSLDANVGGYKIYSKSIAGLQNGAPDGMALDIGGVLCEFISYEGAFTATNGIASGFTSTDIGVAESSSTPVGSSLQLFGMGSRASDFSWTGPVTATRGRANSNQTFSPIPEPTTIAMFGIAMVGLGFRRRR